MESWGQPFASSVAMHERMSTQRRRDTAPEIAVRRAAHALGLRYFVHRRPMPGLRREADLVFPRARVAVFVDGCFWHSCPDHGVSPHVNAAYWSSKLARNVARDMETSAVLCAAGWRVVRVWEHEDPRSAADRIEHIIRGGGTANDSDVNGRSSQAP
jgi:DNA mismatch endonuclease (patch repair protein)